MKEVYKTRFGRPKLRLETEVKLVVLLCLMCMTISSVVQYAELEKSISSPSAIAWSF